MKRQFAGRGQRLTVLSLAITCVTCVKRSGPDVQPPEIVAEAEPSDEPDEQNSTEAEAAELRTHAHALLQMEADLSLTCAGEDGDTWYAQQSKDLDALLATINESLLGVVSFEEPAEASREEVLATLAAIDEALYANGYVVCLLVQLLSETLGDSAPLEGRRLEFGWGRCNIPGYALSPGYRERSVLGHAKGLRAMDCDIAAFLYVSVAQLNGWPLHVVEVPNHNFVRWRFADGTHLNWDVNVAASYTDDEYRRAETPAASTIFDVSDEQAQGYLRDWDLQTTELYYLSLLRPEGPNSAACTVAAYERVIANDELTPRLANHFAWVFSTVPAFRETAHAREAIALAERATGADPSCNYWDTLSCAYAAVGDFERAIEVEQDHISPHSPRIASYGQQRDCYDESVANAGACS